MSGSLLPFTLFESGVQPSLGIFARTRAGYVMVSDRDAKVFADTAGRADVETIPTAVNLDFFGWQPPCALAPGRAPTVVITGSMNWAANIDGVEWFLSAIRPLVRQQEPQAQFVVVGRNPPAALLRRASARAGVRFTGFVDDVRTRVRGAHVFAIPLRVGGGTRIKAFEAMAMGCPVVSTALAVEGLSVSGGEHFVQRDSPQAQAKTKAIDSLLLDLPTRERLSRQAHQRIERRFGHVAAAKVFELVCLRALQRYRAGTAEGGTAGWALQQ